MAQDKFKKVSWDAAVSVGVDKDYLERMGYMELLLDGQPTPPINMVLKMHNSIIWMEGTIQLTEDESGEIIVDVRALEPQEDGDEQG